MPSLESSIRTCKVDTAWDARAQSDRFLNPAQMSCPTWSGFDLVGRKVCPDSFYTKSAGCNSAEDRVVVENNVSRPQYRVHTHLVPVGGGPWWGQDVSGETEGSWSDEFCHEATVTQCQHIASDY